MLAVSPDGTAIAGGYGDRRHSPELMLWTIKKDTVNNQATFVGVSPGSTNSNKDARFSTAAFSEDGTKLATVYADPELGLELWIHVSLDLVKLAH